MGVGTLGATIILTFFEKIKSTDHGWMQNWILRRIKKFFSIFCSFLTAFVLSANMPQKYLLQIYSIWVSKNAEYDVDFESVEKVSRKFARRKLEGWELLHTGLKGGKVYIFYTCMLITFLYEPFNTVLNYTNLKSASDSAFFDTHIKMLWKNICGVILALFTNF